MKSLSRDNHIEVSTATSRYHDDLLNIDNVHFEKKWLTKYILLNFN